MARTRRPCPPCGEPINRGPGQHAYCSVECRPQCAVAGCGLPTVGIQSHCNSHYTILLKNGGVFKGSRWADEWACVVCGKEVQKGSGRRKHCSGRCQQLSSRNPNRPACFDCVKCGTTVSLIVPSTKAGKFKRSNSDLCDRCKRQKKWSMTVGQIAKRDGIDCKICGDPVDMALRKPDLFCASVDHIVPRALGGTDDPQNLQLAHLWCNQVKQKRPDFTFMPEGAVAHGN